MDLLSGSTRREREAQAGDTRAQTHASLALEALFGELGFERRYRALDLGAASGANVEFLAQFCSNIQIEDLYRSLASGGYFAEDGSPSGELPPGVLAFPPGAVFDLVFAWDLFDYIGRAGAQAALERLRPHCPPRSLLFALTSDQKEIPREPIRFKFLDRGKLIYEFASASVRPAERYTPRDFAMLMAGFRVQHSFLLKNGVHEYLFLRE